MNLLDKLAMALNEAEKSSKIKGQSVSNFLLIIEYRVILSASKKTSTKSLEFELRSLPIYQ